MFECCSSSINTYVNTPRRVHHTSQNTFHRHHTYITSLELCQKKNVTVGAAYHTTILNFTGTRAIAKYHEFQLYLSTGLIPVCTIPTTTPWCGMNNHRSDTRISNTVPTITHNETNKDKSMTTNNENNATNPGKKRRLSNSEETKTRGYPKRSMEVEQVDAKTFLFRSPAPLEEIDAIAAKMKSQIDAAQKEISEMGIEAYRKLKSGRERGKGDNDGGVDTDDELMQDEKRREEAIALEEAVVRGNPRR